MPGEFERIERLASAREQMRLWAEDVKVLREQCGYKDSDVAQEALKLAHAEFNRAVVTYSKIVLCRVVPREEHLR